MRTCAFVRTCVFVCVCVCVCVEAPCSSKMSTNNRERKKKQKKGGGFLAGCLQTFKRKVVKVSRRERGCLAVLGETLRHQVVTQRVCCHTKVVHLLGPATKQKENPPPQHTRVFDCVRFRFASNTTPFQTHPYKRTHHHMAQMLRPCKPSVAQATLGSQ